MRILFIILALPTVLGFFLLSCMGYKDESVFFEESITSVYLKQERKIGVYIPKGYSKREVYPVIFVEEGEKVMADNYQNILDSLINSGIIRPVIVAYAYENQQRLPGSELFYRDVEYVEKNAVKEDRYMEIFNNHLNFFVNEFIPHIESKYSVSMERSERIFYGTSNSADFGITLSMRYPELIGEYWCFSPLFSDVSKYGLLKYPMLYRLAWGAKDDIMASFDYFPSLIQAIRKRGGNVSSSIYEGGHERPRWRDQFTKELVQKFGLQ